MQEGGRQRDDLSGLAESRGEGTARGRESGSQEHPGAKCVILFPVEEYMKES